ncbi:response regulator transcription factor [Paenibacillus arenilitoris]|uniref:Response regulator n=1 Tax=Paenibacillus arenilitoris TaxID=2772299 RepID=A0A927H594_9BACL|nr:response regulator [Paenibacillus arenilitoris]MBD2867319.1 response regulator [Paenibacillus arenilitoris]
MNVLLVDDEDYVLDYLETEIPWAALGVSNVYRAGSAKEALDVASNVPLAVVMTDIRMPERSGLELISSLQRHWPETKVILLSGYSDFSYAVKALQLGAADYLLKPVTEDEVLVSLKKVFVKIEEEKRRQKNLEAASDVLKLGIIRMREHLLLDLLLGKKFGADELKRHLQALQLPLEPDTNCVLALIRIETGTEEMTREDYGLLSYALLNMAEEIYFGEIGEMPSLWTCKDDHPFVIALLPEGAAGDRRELVDRTGKLRQAVQTYMKRTVSILLTEPFVFQHGLHRQYLQAINAFWRSVGTRCGVVLDMTGAGNGERAEPAIKPLTRLYQSPTMQQLMDAGRWEEVASRLGHILEELDQPDYRTQQHLMEVVYYLLSSFSYIAHKQGDSFAEMVDSPSLQRKSYHFQTTDQMMEWALPLIEQFKRSLQEVAPNRSHIIRQIHDFIERHLREDVSLTRVGEHVYLHPVYLSRLYKKETGESLSAYITRTRMEKAARLLSSTNMKVADVAREVGYQKTQYFIHIFKEFYDCTPQIYRNR